MGSMRRGLLTRATVAIGAFIAALMLMMGPVQAQEKSYVMKLTLPTLNDPTYQFAKNYAAAIERDSAGRIKTEVYGSSQLGSIPRQIEGTQFGATSNVRSFHRTSLSGWTSASR